MPQLPASLFTIPPARKPAQTSAAPVQLAAIGNYRVDYRGGVLEFYSPYDPGLVAALKSAIPYTHRSWSKSARCWQITPDYADALHSVVLRHAGVSLDIPAATTARAVATDSRLLDIRYIGRIKQREDGTENAFGWANGEWSVIFPKTVLLNWFGQSDPDTGTLWSVLGIAPTADGKAIKSAYRRAARSWHPDVSSEPDAAEQFIRIQRAYEVLSDPAKRAKYSAGLALQASVKDNEHQHEWTPPVRCGYIFASGINRLGRFIVERIHQWEDITNSTGQILVSSWPMGASAFEERWA